MERKPTIREALLTLSLQRLANRTAQHDIVVDDRRKKASHVDALLRDRSLEEVLDLLRRDDLRELCAGLQVSTQGTKQELHGRVRAKLEPPRSASATASPKRTRKARTTGTRSSRSRSQRRNARRRNRAVVRNRHTGRSSLGWDDIAAEDLEALGPEDFEQFCAQLIRIECHDRHAASAHVEGPPAPSRPGEDLRLLVSEPPILSRAQYQRQWYLEALTEDSSGTMVYSCKTGLDWRKKVKEEARESSQWALQTLQAGGRLAILINEPRDSEQQPLERELAKEYRKRMRGKKPTQKDIESRIRVIDANDLATFLRRRRPLELSLKYRKPLGCGPIDGLREFDDWASTHERDRGRDELGSLTYRRDPERADARNALLAVMRENSRGDSFGPQVAWLLGRPGVGKTRLVIELLREHDDIQRRTLVAITADEAIAALGTHRLFERFPTAVLVIDDCPARDLDRVATWLPSSTDGTVIAITPCAENYRPRGLSPLFQNRRIELRPMSPTANEQLIRQVLTEPYAEHAVRQVAALTEGYPWFAILVAHEILRSGQLPRTATEAAEYALRSHDEPRDLASQRARLLFLVLLTENVDWDGLQTPEWQALCLAVGLRDRDDAEELFRQCVRRGLIRTRLGRAYKYVTPAILAREVLLMLLHPPPDEPPLGPRLREHAATYLPRLYERLADFGLPGHVLARFAEPIVREFESGALVAGVELSFAANHHGDPARLSAAIQRRVEGLSRDRLARDVNLRARFFDAIISLAHRRGSFETAESALFRLAVTEADSFFYRARRPWAELFVIAPNQTYRPFSDRFRRLRQRCTEIADEPGHHGRVLALDGVEAALTGDCDWHPPIDGSFLEPTRDDVAKAIGDVWSLLLDLMLDEQQEVTERAGNIAVEYLSRAGVAKLSQRNIARLVALVPRLSEPIQRRLRRSVEDASQRYTRSVPAVQIEPQPYAALRDALHPRRYAERLRHHVGSYSAYADDSDVALDIELAREGLQPPQLPVVEQSRWLVSGEAQRGVSFAVALGTEDRDGIMRAPLLDHLDQPDAANIVSAYFLGWHRAGREQEVRQVLRDLLPRESASRLVTHLLYRLGADDERIEMLTQMLATDGFQDELLRVFAMGWNLQQASSEAVIALARVAQQRDAEIARQMALTLLVSLGRQRPDTLDRFTVLLAEILSATALAQIRDERLEGGLAVRWRRGIDLLVSVGMDVTQLLLDALSYGSPSLGKTPLWKAFQECAARAPHQVFIALARLYEARGPTTARRLSSGLSTHRIVEKLATADIMDWIDSDDERASWVAGSVDLDREGPLPELVRAMIMRFGTNARCSAVLSHSVLSPNGTVGSLAEWLNEQLTRVSMWTRDSDAEVREWANSLLGQVQSRYQREQAYEEHEELRQRASQLVAARP